ncbi:MAG: Fic family protein [Deltaproteobacteria bacterium]|nr:Fic family protein [Deltaproteobacteria bacterium]
MSKMFEEGPDRLTKIIQAAQNRTFKTEPYPHWDKILYLTPPEGLSHKEWWLGVKIQRNPGRKKIPLRDAQRRYFSYVLADPIPERLHEIDMYIGGGIQMPSQITNPETKDQYYVESLIEEAITSSQLEHATTTRRVAREMIRTGRKPSDRSEQMIFNNYRTMQAISEVKNEPLSKDLIFRLHRLITEDTLDDPSAAGRFRRPDEEIYVGDDTGERFYTPPPAEELESRIKILCKFANKEIPKEFVHPAIRAVLLHFWLAFDHPFVDGNGRTARALFYWAMLRYGFWLSEYISISHIILKGPSKYSRAFLYTETDDNDLTYFLVYHLDIIRRAIEALHEYIRKQASKVAQVEKRLRNVAILNYRQRALISHALKHPSATYTFRTHQTSHNIVYQTARLDLLELEKFGLLTSHKIKKRWYFQPAKELETKLTNLR